MKDLKRFLSYINQNSKIFGENDKYKTECWQWTGGTVYDGYGYFWFSGKAVRAHRWSYEHYCGKIPNDLQIDHLCRNRLCVNPDHLEAVTCRTNLLRGKTFASRALDTHCFNGHKYTDANTYINPKGHRTCKTCRRNRQRLYDGYKGLKPSGERTHCPYGHKYSEDNIYINPSSGSRCCRKCIKSRGKQKV